MSKTSRPYTNLNGKRIHPDSKPITFDGKTMNRREWAENLGISEPALRVRLKRWPLEEALTAPKKKGRNLSPGPRLAWIEQAGGAFKTSDDL